MRVGAGSTTINLVLLTRAAGCLVVAIAALALATPAGAAVTVGAESDARDLPATPGRDLQFVRSSYDTSGAWVVSLRFYGPVVGGQSVPISVSLAESFVNENAGDSDCGDGRAGFALSLTADLDPGRGASRVRARGAPVPGIAVARSFAAQGREVTWTMTAPTLAGGGVGTDIGVCLANLRVGDWPVSRDYGPPWVFFGPPPAGDDGDGDGIRGALDLCPDDPSRGTDGCPEPLPSSTHDRDRDRTPDVRDVCPVSPATAPDGCPPRRGVWLYGDPSGGADPTRLHMRRRRYVEFDLGAGRTGTVLLSVRDRSGRSLGTRRIKLTRSTRERRHVRVALKRAARARLWRARALRGTLLARLLTKSGRTVTRTPTLLLRT